MCGICGFWERHMASEQKEEIITKINRKMIHRGPDNEGYYVDENIALGHRRLSIIDLKHGHQPIFNETGDIVVVFNGEIYNYRDLQEYLIQKGHKFKTNCDTEVLVHAYEEYGMGFIKKLNGMFAFAIWDKHNRKLCLARDRFGIKPLYFYKKNDLFGFASEVKPLLAHPWVEKRINYEAMDYFFNFRYIPAPHTMFQNLYKLEPGHYLIVRETGEITCEQYWDMRFDLPLITHTSEEEYLEEFRNRFEDSIRKRLMSEVPLGILLSGGLDSSAIVAGLSRNISNRLKTFSIGFKDDADYNELNFAQMVSEKFNTEHYEIEIDHDEFMKGVLSYLKHVEEPMGDPASIPLFYVSKLASEHVTVVLSGEGSDEILAGYNVYRVYDRFNRHKKFRKIPQLLRNTILRPINKYVICSDSLDRYLRASDNDLKYHHIFFIHDHSSGSRFSVDDRRTLYSQTVLNQINLKTNTELLLPLYLRAANFDVLSQSLYVQIKYWLPSDLLLKADKMTMAHSLELRVPFLDHSFAEYTTQLPNNFKVRKVNGKYITKYILRKAYEDILPETVLTRLKKGFPVPLHMIFERGLLARLQELIHSTKIEEADLFNFEFVKKIINQFEKQGKAGTQLEKRLWSIYVLCEWYHMYF